MNGYYIGITNKLLEAKHREKMQESVWLFMWLLDKMTSISEEGIGKVLGGRPVKYEEVKKDLGISRSTFQRWVNILEKEKYIITIRTPYGLSFSVKKAKKTFGKKVDKPVETGGQLNKRCVANEQRCVIDDTSNIRQYKDNKQNIYNNDKKIFSKLSFRGMPVVKDKFTGKLKAYDNQEWCEIDERFLHEVKINK